MNHVMHQYALMSIDQDGYITNITRNQNVLLFIRSFVSYWTCFFFKFSLILYKSDRKIRDKAV